MPWLAGPRSGPRVKLTSTADTGGEARLVARGVDSEAKQAPVDDENDRADEDDEAPEEEVTVQQDDPDGDHCARDQEHSGAQCAGEL
jgi:hypothetical protein